MEGKGSMEQELPLYVHLGVDDYDDDGKGAICSPLSPYPFFQSKQGTENTLRAVIPRRKLRLMNSKSTFEYYLEVVIGNRALVRENGSLASS